MHETEREKYFLTFLFAETHPGHLGKPRTSDECRSKERATMLAMKHRRLPAVLVVVIVLSALPGCGRYY